MSLLGTIYIYKNRVIPSIIKITNLCHYKSKCLTSERTTPYLFPGSYYVRRHIRVSGVENEQKD